MNPAVLIALAAAGFLFWRNQQESESPAATVGGGSVANGTTQATLAQQYANAADVTLYPVSAEIATLQARATNAWGFTSGSAGPGSWAKESTGPFMYLGSGSLNVPEGSGRDYFEGVSKRRMMMLADFRGQGTGDVDQRQPWDFWQGLYMDTWGLWPARKYPQTGLPADQRTEILMNIGEWFDLAFPNGWELTDYLPLIAQQYPSPVLRPHNQDSIPMVNWYLENFA